MKIKKKIKTIEPEIKEIDEKERVIWHKISRETIDRMGDIVRIDGIDKSNFKKKPAVLYGHRYGDLDPLPVIGENIGFKQTGKTLYAGTKFLPPDGLSEKLGDLISDLWILNKKNLLGWSVGFIVKEVEEMKDKQGHFTGLDFKKTELLEYSNVIIPAHQDAINDAMNAGTVSKSFGKWIEKRTKAAQDEDPSAASNLEIGTIGTEIKAETDQEKADIAADMVAETEKKDEIEPKDEMENKKTPRIDRRASIIEEDSQRMGGDETEQPAKKEQRKTIDKAAEPKGDKESNAKQAINAENIKDLSELIDRLISTKQKIREFLIKANGGKNIGRKD